MEELENNNELNNNNDELNNNVSTKNRFTALIMCWFLGFFGIHRMYAGKVVTGILMLYGTIASVAVSFVYLPAGLAGLTVVGAVVVYDFIVLALKKFTDCYGKEMTSDKVN